MVDVEKILGLTTDERDVIKDLIKLHDEAEDAVNLIVDTWQFKIGVDEIDLRPYTTGLGYKNCLTHDGKWAVSIDNEDKVENVNISKEEIYKLFEARYLVDYNLLTENMETDDKLYSKTKLCSLFQHFLDATKRQAEEN